MGLCIQDSCIHLIEIYNLNKDIQSVQFACFMIKLPFFPMYVTAFSFPASKNTILMASLSIVPLIVISSLAYEEKVKKPTLTRICGQQ